MEIKPLIIVRDPKSGILGNYRMNQEKILIGRDDRCFIVLKNPQVSREHAEIFRENDLFFLRDLRSDNRTLLNNSPLTAGEKMMLQMGDLIQVGPYELRFQAQRAGDDLFYEITDTDVLEIKMVKKMLRALDHESAPSLEILEGPEVGRRFVLEGKSQSILIGRDTACEFRIPDEIISRKHVRITRAWDTVEVEDLKSRNGTFVGKEKIEKKILKDGDLIHLGNVLLVFRNPQELEADLKVSPAPKPKTAPTPPSPPPPSPPPEPRPEKKELSIPFSSTEILMILIGLIVLISALWGILKIL